METNMAKNFDERHPICRREMKVADWKLIMERTVKAFIAKRRDPGAEAS